MAGEIKFAFETNECEGYWEVATVESGERIATAETEDQARALEAALNMALSDWTDETPRSTTCAD